MRNAVGLDVHPETGELWAVNNGRDLMGDDLPPESLYIVNDGADYGWPRCHSGNIEDPDFDMLTVDLHHELEVEAQLCGDDY